MWRNFDGDEAQTKLQVRISHNVDKQFLFVSISRIFPSSFAACAQEEKKRPKSNCTRELPHHTNECISAARLHNEPRRIEIFFVSRARAHWMWKLKTQFIALFTLRRSFVLAMRANQNCGMNALRRVTFN